MPTDRPLLPITDDALAQSIAHALRFDGKRRIKTGDEFMARLMAEHLVKHMKLCGLLVMRREAGPEHLIDCGQGDKEGLGKT